jgi:hypothetical protein
MIWDNILQSFDSMTKTDWADNQKETSNILLSEFLEIKNHKLILMLQFRWFFKGLKYAPEKHEIK